MTLVTTAWDSAEHLKTEEDIRLYLEARFEEAGDDPGPCVCCARIGCCSPSTQYKPVVQGYGSDPGGPL